MSRLALDRDFLRESAELEKPVQNRADEVFAKFEQAAHDEDPGAHSRDLLRERSLLFVACTRAREQLSVSWHQAPSPFIEAVLFS